jgi:hypothetical protein
MIQAGGVAQAGECLLSSNPGTAKKKKRKRKKENDNSQQGEVVNTCNPSTLEAEAGELRVRGQPMKYSETLSQKKRK